MFKNFKANINLIRKVIRKLKSINYYLEEVFLVELGLSKGSFNWKKLDLRRGIARTIRIKGRELKKLERAACYLIKNVVILDDRLLKKYKEEEEKIIEEEDISIKDVESILKKQSDILDHLESKIPPASKIKIDLFKKYDVWTSRVLALLPMVVHEHEKERIIFNRLKQKKAIKSRIDMRIKDLVEEKLKLVDLREKRALSWEKVWDIDEKLREASHHFGAASML